MKNTVIDRRKSAAGFTIIELMLSALLGLVIATFSFQALHDFISAENYLDSRYRALQKGTTVIDSLVSMTEIAGFLPSESLSFASSWNYKDRTNSLNKGEVVRINGNSDADVIAVRLIGDSYQAFRDCLGAEFDETVEVHMLFSLYSNNEFSCRARHYDGNTLLKDTRRTLMTNILKIRVTALIRNDSGNWRTVTNTNNIEKHSYIKAVLFEVLTRSDNPVHPEPVTQSFKFFQENFSVDSRYLVVYQSKLLTMSNQEHQVDI